MTKRLLSLLLALVTVLSLTAPAWAASEPASGSYLNTSGNRITWTISDGVLTISGKGEMDVAPGEDEDWWGAYPWENLVFTKVVIKDGITNIADDAFDLADKLTDVTIPGSVTSIGDCAFYDCWSLTDVTIPGSVTSIGDRAFYDCWSLTGVTISEGVKTIGESAFFDCEKLTSVTIPGSVTSIGKGAFYWCNLLSSVTISEGVKTIGESAFCSCYELADMTIPKSVTSIGAYAFEYCESMSKIFILNPQCSIADSAGTLGSFFDGDYDYDEDWGESGDKFAIFGEPGSTAESYAKKYNHAFGYLKTSAPEPSLKNVKKGIEISWPAAEGAVRYRLFYKTGSNSWKELVSTYQTRYVWTKAKAGIRYSFAVQCIANGTVTTSDMSAEKSIARPAAPVISSLSDTADGVTVKWDAVDGAAAYRLFYMRNGNWTALADTTSTSYTWTGAKGGTSYSFTVRCITADGSEYTSPYDATGKSITTAPDAPKLSSVSNTTGGVKIAWGKVTGAEKYRVFYKTTGSWKKLADTTSTSYTWTGAKGGTSYSFTVRCISADGSKYTSDYDTMGLSITTPSTTLATPKITSVTANGTAVTVKWGAVEGAEQYRLFYMKDGKWTKLKDTTGTSVTLNGTYGKTYTYTVRCISADGSKYTSSYDATGKSITLTNSQLDTPQITSVTANGKAVTVKWGKVDGAEAYRLFFMKDGKWTKLKDTSGTSYTANGTYGKTYTYTVRCITKDGSKYTSSYDATGLSITLINSQLATPKITSVTADGKAVTVTWGAVDGAEAYRLFYMKDGKWTKLKDTTGTSVTLNGKEGKTYTYTVRCITADGSKYTSSYDATGLSITLEK